MVGAVKRWQKSDPEKSLDIWRKLSEANFALEVQLNSLSKLAEEHRDAYKSVINDCSGLRPDKVILEFLFVASVTFLSDDSLAMKNQLEGFFFSLGV